MSAQRKVDKAQRRADAAAIREAASRLLADVAGPKGLWCLACQASNAAGGDDQRLLEWLGYTSADGLDCQGERGDLADLLRRLRERGIS